jgi:hypothetical protein
VTQSVRTGVRGRPTGSTLKAGVLLRALASLVDPCLPSSRLLEANLARLMMYYYSSSSVSARISFNLSIILVRLVPS